MHGRDPGFDLFCLAIQAFAVIGLAAIGLFVVCIILEWLLQNLWFKPREWLLRRFETPEATQRRHTAEIYGGSKWT